MKPLSPADWRTILAVLLGSLLIVSFAHAACTTSLVALPGGKTMSCETCCSDTGFCVTRCF